MHNTVHGLAFTHLNVEPSFGSVGQHQRHGTVVDPDQFGQPHGIQPSHIGNRCRRVPLDTPGLRLTQSEHSGTGLPEREPILRT